MSDQRPDDETLGRALGRAVESQSVSETPFSRSRLSSRVDRPARGGWMGTLAVAAALGLFVAMGAFFASRGPQSGVATPDASATPTVSATSGPVRTQSAAPSATATPSVITGRVYYARDGLPPVGVDRSLELEPGMSADRLPAEQHIGRLLAALGGKTAQVPAGAIDAFPRSDPAGYHGQRVAVAGDLATIDFEIRRPNGDWGIRGAAQSQALLQQIVYTATEVPGIRRVRLLQNGSPLAIDQLVVDKPLSREDVAGYSVPAEMSLTLDEEQRAATATTTVSNEVVAPALGRLAIELRPTTPVPGGFWSPPLKAELLPTTPGSGPKWALSVTLPGVTDPRAGSLVGAGPLQEFDGGAIRSLRVRREANGVTYELYLDDARPWRIALQRGADGAMRVLVDVGGPPSRVTNNTAVYAVQAGPGTQTGLGVFGVARAFEATVNWRVRDRTGREVAKGFTNASVGTSPYYGTFEFLVPMPSSLDGATLEVYQASPRDGSDTNKVTVPLGVR